MKSLHCFILILTCISFTSAQDTALVYYTRDISPAGVLKVYEKIQSHCHGKVAVKVHFGEEGNRNFLPASLMKDLVLKENATLVETNVLYVGKRRYTESHIQLAKDHGFTYAPIDILDSEGDIYMPMQTKHYKEIRMGSHMDRYDTFIIFSHYKGHGLSGFGGAIKNVGMGMAAIGGKMAQHASTVPTYDTSKCTKCGRCVTQCPAGAISLNPLYIDTSKCIGCGKCIGECPERLYGVPWKSTDSPLFLERLVDYAYGISKGRNMLYINVLANISRLCDCAKHAPLPFVDDIGILASTDMVAIDAASLELVNQAHGCDDAFLKENKVSGNNQIEYGYEIGLGNKVYKIIDLDKP